MAEGFDDINAPQFFDFNKDVKNMDDTCEGYFEQEDETLMDPLNNSDIFSAVTILVDELEEGTLSRRSHFRKSMSVGNLEDICENIHKLRNGKVYVHTGINQENQDDSPLVNTNSTHSLNEVAGPSTTSYSRSGSKEFINRLAQPKRQFNSDQALNTNVYIPMAEALNKFQNGTPKRFRTKPNTTKEPLKCTIPQSPKLKTVVRNRPVYTLSHEEQEELALNEAKKSQFKAHPLNKKVLQPPLLPSTSKGKRSTVPEPFKLTAVPTKTVSESPKKKAPAFHARPVPKSLYEPTIKAPLKPQVTKPQTPSFMGRYNAFPLKAEQKKNENIQQTKLKVTKPLPFSFELRDQYLQSKRDNLIQKCREAEKKAREFHAQPIPKSVVVTARKLHSYGSRSSLQSIGKTKSEDNMTSTSFKAKPPTVLYKKPFEPIRPNRPLVEVADFTLNTDLRSRDRENFDHHLREKEERIALLRHEEEMMRKQQEEEEMLRARKEAAFKAREIKKFKELKIQPSQKVTIPISPKFNSKKLKNTSGNKENAL